jgi:hypothetical protein
METIFMTSFTEQGRRRHENVPNHIDLCEYPEANRIGREKYFFLLLASHSASKEAIQSSERGGKSWNSNKNLGNFSTSRSKTARLWNTKSSSPSSSPLPPLFSTRSFNEEIAPWHFKI